MHRSGRPAVACQKEGGPGPRPYPKTGIQVSRWKIAVVTENGISVAKKGQAADEDPQWPHEITNLDHTIVVRGAMSRLLNGERVAVTGVVTKGADIIGVRIKSAGGRWEGERAAYLFFL